MRPVIFFKRFDPLAPVGSLDRVLGQYSVLQFAGVDLHAAKSVRARRIASEHDRCSRSSMGRGRCSGWVSWTGSGRQGSKRNRRCADPMTMADRDVCTAAVLVGNHWQMKPGTRSWKRVTAEVLALLSELDPYRLDPGMPEGAPADECAAEADAIARHLLFDGPIELDQVDAIWRNWFGESLSQVTSAGAAENLVARLNRLVQAARSDGTDTTTEDQTIG
jgi:hypothetical protein